MRLARVTSLLPAGVAGQIQALSLVPLAIFIVLLIAGTLIVIGDNQIARDSTLITQRLSASDAVYTALDQQSQAIANVRSTRATSALHVFEQNATALDRALARLDELIPKTAAESGLYGSYRRDTVAVEALLRRFLGFAKDRDTASAARNEKSPAVTSLLRRWRDEKTLFDDTEQRRILDEYGRMNRRLDPIRQLNFLAIVLGAIATLAAAATAGRRIVHRLNRLSVNARRLAGGHEIEALTGTDEIAMLDATVRELTVQLRASAREREQALADYQREHDIAMTLQHALLPSDLPSVAGLHVHTAYVAADDAGVIGGDWYDVFLLDERLVGISVGDIAGHGIRAATRMSAVRQSIRTAARATNDPGLVLQHVNRVLCAENIDSFVSAFFGTIDMDTGILRYALAGHPPPLLVGPDGSTGPLGGSGTVLGIDAAMAFDVQEVVLQPASAMALYTDGLIEQGRDAINGMQELVCATRAEVSNPSCNPADGLQRRVLRDEAPRDDSAVLFLFFDGFGPVPKRREWTLDARNEQAATRVKRALLRYLADLRIERDALIAELIYGELVSNVARHTPGQAKIVIEEQAGTVVISVCDRGKPFSPQRTHVPELAETGRGIDLIQALTGSIRIERLENGNCVSVQLAAKNPGPEKQAVASAVLDYRTLV